MKHAIIALLTDLQRRENETMVELKLYVSDVDYDSVFQALAGRLAGPAALAARALPDSAKEELVAKYINGNSAKIEEKIEKMLASKGVRVKISGAQATVQDA